MGFQVHQVRHAFGRQSAGHPHAADIRFRGRHRQTRCQCLMIQEFSALLKHATSRKERSIQRRWLLGGER